MSTCPTCFQEIEILPDTFGNRVMIGRAKRDWSRAEMAEFMGYERTSMITRWENGTVVPKDIDTVELIAQSLDVTPAWLLYGVDEPKMFEVDVEVVDDQFAEDLIEGEDAVVDESDEGEFFSGEEDTESSGRARPAILNKIKGQS